MEYKVVVYKKENGEEPVKDFLLSLSDKHRAKAFWEIDLLKDYGTDIKEPYVKAIGGEYKGLWELRIKFASDISRIFYFMPMGDTFVLLHGFVKKTQETPKRELVVAKKYMEDYKRRLEDNE